MKKVYLVIIFVIAFICIIVGSVFHFTKKFSFIKNAIKSEVKAFDIDSLGDEVEKSWEFININKLKIDACVSKLVIEEGDSFRVDYEGREKYMPNVTEESGNVLHVKQPKISTVGINNVSIDCRINITVPKGTELDKIDIESNVGDVKLLSLTSDSIIIKADVGSTTLEECSADEIKVSAAVGNVSVIECSVDRLETDAEVGETFIKKCTFNELKADGEVGAVDVELTDSIEDYECEIGASLGGVRVDGRNEGKKYNVRNSGASKYIDINAQIGGVDIKSNR